MEDPVRDIDSVIASLTQGDDARQQATLNYYFTPDAYFVHPLCRVPSFSEVQVPILGTWNSRWFVSRIYRWYRILSPKIKFHISSKALDNDTDLLYVSMSQVFKLWFDPSSLWQAHAKLVTVLELQRLPVDRDGQPVGNPPYADLGDMDIPYRYFIRGQEDNYQMTEWLKFVLPLGGQLIWRAVQLVSTLVCAVCVFLFWPLSYLQRGGLRRKTD